METCIFCKIVKGEIESSKFWENEEYIGILDLFPNTKGAALVVSKKHHESNYLNIDDEILNGFMLSSRQAALKLRNGLNINRVAAAVEGTGVDHLHMHLYPLHETSETQEDVEPIYIEKYNGYITTKPGPMAKREDLDKLAGVIAGA